MPLLIYLLEFKTLKNGHLYHEFVKIKKTYSLAYQKKSFLLSFLYIDLFTYL